MEKVKSNNIFQEFTPSFYTGIFSILMPTKRGKHLREAIKTTKQNDGFGRIGKL